VSENLKAFLRAWLDWVEAGAPDCRPFKRRCGLCSNLDAWARALVPDIRIDLEGELELMFKVDGLDQCHPFGFDAYFDARGSETQHLDTTRLAWVRSKIAQHEVA
jgi:hypothetical protein